MANGSEEPNEEAPKKRASGSNVAYRGNIMNLNDAPAAAPMHAWPVETQEDRYIPASMDDFTDLNAATRELVHLRILLHKARRQLDEARREEAAAMMAQRQHYNRELVAVSGGTEALRKAFAEIQNEPYMSRVMVAQAVAKEKMELSRTVAKEIEAWKTICDNIRKQMSI